LLIYIPLISGFQLLVQAMVKNFMTDNSRR